jgi:hypothetical protein
MPSLPIFLENMSLPLELLFILGKVNYLARCLGIQLGNLISFLMELLTMIDCCFWAYFHCLHKHLALNMRWIFLHPYLAPALHSLQKDTHCETLAAFED